MTYSLGSVSDLGYVQKESLDKQSNLMTISLPGEDKPFIFDFFGATKTIGISGRKVDTYANLVTFIDNLQGLVTGQQNSITYTSDILGALTDIYVDSVNLEWDVGEIKTGDITGQSVVSYSIVLQQAKAL